MRNLLQQFSGEDVIVGGDFNCPLAKDDKQGGRDLSSNKNAVADVKFYCPARDAGMAQVVRALVSHQCGPGSISRSGVICELWIPR